MKIALCSDEPYRVNEIAAAELERLQHQVIRFGSCASHHEEPFVEVTNLAALAVARGECDQGIFFCYSGTGASIVANKVPGIRAALCTDVATVHPAKIWNGANVLVLSNRLLSDEVVKEMINAWLEPCTDTRGEKCIADLRALDGK